MRHLAVLGAAVLVLSAVTACAERRNSQQVRIYEGCVFQLARNFPLAPSNGADGQSEPAWGKLALGEPATNLQQCACHADELYWMIRGSKAKGALVEFYEGGGKEALSGMSELNQSALETVCT